MAVLNLSEEIEVFKHAERQKRVGALKTLQDRNGEREITFRECEDQMERTGTDD